MNYILKDVSARTLAVLTIVSLIVSAFPAAFFVAEAQEAPNPASIETIDAQAASYEAGTEIALKALRGDTLTGTLTVALSSATGGVFGDATLSGCNDDGSFAVTDITIASNGNQKAFCYKNANVGVDTITATFTEAAPVENGLVEEVVVTTLVVVGEETATLELEIVEPNEPVVPTEDLTLTAICNYEAGGSKWRVRNDKNDFDVDFTWEIYSNQETGGPITATFGEAFGDGDTFFDSTLTGTMKIYWLDENDEQQEKTKAAGNVVCEPEPEPEPEVPQICSFAGTVVDATADVDAKTNGGDLVNPARRNLTAVETVAPYVNFFGQEGNDWQVNPLDFVSLGIGGYVVYEFTDKVAVDQPGDDIAVWEITGGSADQQSDEMVKVYLSANGVDFELADTITGDGSVDIADTTLEYVKFVKLVDMSQGIQGDNGDGYDLDAITIIDGSCQDFAKIVAHKIVCTDEAEFPNWGYGGPNIIADTAQDWVDTHNSCEFERNWEFEWGPSDIATYPGDALVGPAGPDWTTFGPTDADGMTMTVVTEDQIEGNSHLWFREVLQDNFIPFTFDTEGGNNDNYSAKNKCNTDVRNYDNFDRIDGIATDETYYCVAWNVAVAEPEPMCTLTAVSDTGTVVVENNQFAVETYDENTAWTASIPGATWIWNTFFVENPTQDETYTFREDFMFNGASAALLEVAADNTYKVTINGTLVADVTDENNFKNISQDSYDVISYLQDGMNWMEIEVTNIGINATAQKNPAGVLYKLTVDAETECKVTTDINPEEPEEPEYGPYCGDGIVQGEDVEGGWEQCDGGESCTAYCTWENQCQIHQLVKIDLDQDVDGESFDGKIYLGSSDTVIPNGTWFNFNEVGDDSFVTTANNSDGLAVQRDTGNNKLFLGFVGGNGSKQLDIASGQIMTLGIDLSGVDRSPNPSFKLEDGSGSSFDDVFAIDSNDNSIDFDLRADTGNDGVSVVIGEGEQYDCPACKATVEARIVLQDGVSIDTNGAGNLTPTVRLGDGSTVAFGEWFPISEELVEGESAVYIDDAETVTNFTNPADIPSLFVSREGNGEVKVALYGFHNPGGDANYESLRATIEFNDGKILGGATEQIPGNFKLENHSEADNVNSNDNFDSFSEHGDRTAVDFDFWVDTKADGITITLDDESIEACDGDTDPQVEPVLYDVYGYKWNDTNGDGDWDDLNEFPMSDWTIEVTNGVDTFATTTDANGYYYFEVPAGEWVVSEVQQVGWTQTFPVEPNTCTYSFYGANDKQLLVKVLEDYVYQDEYYYQGDFCNFGNQADDDGGNGGDEEMFTIEGYKFEDVDGNGFPNEEIYLADWTIEVTNGVDTFATTTDANGYYYFEVPAGEWVVSEVQQVGWTQTFPVEPTTCTYEFVDTTTEESARFVVLDNYCDFGNQRNSDDGGGDGDSGGSITNTNSGNNGSSISGRRSINTAESSEEAGPVQQVAGATTQCGMYLYDYTRMGLLNDVWEVQKLQAFLTGQGFFTPMTGVFDVTTDANVKLFQAAHKIDVLDPWFEAGIVPHDRPTGWVYKTTRWKINNIVCPGSEAYPSLTGETL